MVQVVPPFLVVTTAAGLFVVLYPTATQSELDGHEIAELLPMGNWALTLQLGEAAPAGDAWKVDTTPQSVRAAPRARAAIVARAGTL